LNTTAKPYDIKRRTFEFAVDIISFVNELPQTSVMFVLGKQLIRSGTSVGANIEEADGTDSRKDFIYKVSIARKEARETNYWLRIIEASHNCKNIRLSPLIKESLELILILSKIMMNTKSNC
jgi:four helix bundle protein